MLRSRVRWEPPINWKGAVILAVTVVVATWSLARAEDAAQATRGMAGATLAKPQSLNENPIEVHLDHRDVRVVGVATDGSVQVSTSNGAVKDFTIPIENLGVKMPVTVELSSKGEAQVIRPQSVAKWSQIQDQWYGDNEFARKPGVKAVGDALKKIESLVKPYLSIGQNPPKSPQLEEAYKKAEAAVDGAYRVALTQNDERYRTGVASTDSRLSAERKSFYGPNNNVWPEAIEVMTKRFKASVGLMHPGKQDGKRAVDWTPNVSGVLISPNLVLTCAHDITDDPDDDQKVQAVIGYVHEDGVIKPGKRIAVDKIIYNGMTNGVDHDHEPLDFAIFQLSEKVQDLPPMALSSAAVPLDTGIYLIGYPQGGPETVHTNTHVLFPYELNSDGMSKIKLRIQRELVGVEQNTATLTDRLFRNSYERVATSKGAPLFRYFMRLEGQHMPVMGADCDTFHGDSGAPAFFLAAGSCCGLLTAGSSDKDNYDVATFLHHEKLIPMKVILNRLSDRQVGLKGWPGDFGVSIE
jgi:V8-like Glu-specific endopeptidase